MSEPGVPAFRAGLALLRSVRRQTLSLTGGLSQAQLDFSPSEGRWSAGEILDHLILAERLYRVEMADLIACAKSGRKARLRRSTRDLNVRFAFIPPRVLPALEIPFTVLNALVPRRVRELVIRHKVLRVRNPDAGGPRRGRPSGELRQELEASVEETSALLESNAELDFDRMTISHPLLGTNSIPQLLRVAALHEERHHTQIFALVRHACFPPNA